MRLRTAARGFLALLFLTGGSLFTGCLLDEGAACGVDGDCRSGLVCSIYTNRCAAPGTICERDRDCGDPALVCGPESLCVPKGSAGTPDTTTPPEDTTEPHDTGSPPPNPDAFPTWDAHDVELPACPPVPARMLRVTHMAIGTGGQPGQGLDIDHDPATCAPNTRPGQCSAGIDNAFAGLSGAANPELANLIAEGSLNLLFAAYPGIGEPCPVLVFSRFGVGLEAPYGVAPLDDPTACEAAGVRFDDACVLTDGKTLVAGLGGRATFPVLLRMMGAEMLIPVRQARIEAEIKTDEHGWSELQGVVGGVILPHELEAALANLPPLDPSPADILPVLVTPDLDLNGDGTKDAYSVGVVIQAEAVGVTTL